MNKRMISFTFLTVAVCLSLAATGCGLIPLTGAQIKTGPVQTTDIQVPLPDAASTGIELNLQFATGNIQLAPGAQGYLASGTATYNAAEFTPKVETDGASYTLRQGEVEIKGLPKVSKDLKSEWNLQLADTPMSLKIDAGPYNGSFELGGLSLEKLAISEIGSDMTGAFSKPNQVKMSSFTYKTGGSKIRLTGLANANFEQMAFESGAGDYTLSFDGDLQRDADVQIDTGVSTMTIIVPDGVNARVKYEGGLSSVNPEGAWVQDGSVYTLAGDGPALTITVKMGMGTLNLKNE